MITFFGSLLGFFSSAFPSVLKAYRDNKDRTHELHILDRQLDMLEMGHNHHLEEIQINADTQTTQALYKHAQPTGVRWIDAFAGTVRPFITYSFFILYALMKYGQWIAVCQSTSAHWAESVMLIWGIEDQALFSTVISFWFGQRMLQKAQTWHRK